MERFVLTASQFRNAQVTLVLLYSSLSDIFTYTDFSKQDGIYYFIFIWSQFKKIHIIK